MGTHARWMRSGGTCSCSFALSGCSDPDDSPSAPLGSARWGAGTGAPFMESASTNIHQQSPANRHWEHLHVRENATGEETKLLVMPSYSGAFGGGFFRFAIRKTELLRWWRRQPEWSESARFFSSRGESTRPPSVAFVYPTVTWISIGSDAQRRTGLIYTGAQPWWNWFDGNQRTLPCRRSR